MHFSTLLPVSLALLTVTSAQRVPGLFRRQSDSCTPYETCLSPDGIYTTCYDTSAGDECCSDGAVCNAGYYCGTGRNVAYCCPDGTTETECYNAPVGGTATAAGDPTATDSIIATTSDFFPTSTDSPFTLTESVPSSTQSSSSGSDPSSGSAAGRNVIPIAGLLMAAAVGFALL